jgi:hypothetical protein
MAWLCVVGKHALPRYLIPLILLAGISSVLIWHVCRRLGIGAALRTGLIALVVLSLAGQPWKLAARAGDIRQETQLRRQAAYIVASGGGRIIEATPAASQAGAMRYGQIYAPARFGADLRRLYPGVTAWDLVSGINAFGAPADPTPVMAALPDGGASFLMMGVQGYPVVDSPPAGVVLKRVRSLGRHALYEGRVLPCAGASAGPFAGFFDSTGLRWTALPEPLFLGSSPTRLLVTGNGSPMTLALQVRPQADGMGRLRVSVNGRKLARPPLESATRFEDVSVGFEPRLGVNEILLEYGPPTGSESVVPVMAFRRLQVRCESGG